MVTKTRKSESLLADLEDTFTNLRANWVKLNPSKCVFGVPAKKLVGFLVAHHGIEVNPSKIKDIKQMQSATRLKDEQHLTGLMDAMG